MPRRLIAAEQIIEARDRSRRRVEILPGDIVTIEAQEMAERLGIRLEQGPFERPAPIVTDGATAARRALWRRSPRWVAPKQVTSRTPARIGKLALVGAGGVGANIAHLAANLDMAEHISLIDIAPGVAESTALDLNHAAGVTRSRSQAEGGTSLSLVSGADVVVVSAGRARGPGMTRADLIDINKRIIHSTGEAIAAHAPNAIVIVITNPLDEMTLEMLRVTGFPRNQVLGMAGTLDTSRFRTALALAARVEVRDVEALTLGAHGDEMAPIVSHSRIKGRSLDAWLSEEQVKQCVQDAITGGGQVVALKKTGSATIAPAHACVEVIDHIRGARLGTLPVSVMLDGEYGIEDVVLGVPCHLGQSGLVAVEELSLPEHELTQLQQAAAAIKARLGTA